VNLHEYDLGNGFSPFDTPRGTSRFDQLLFAGTTYFWVTSQWSAFAAFSEFTNTISGPGAVLVAGQGCNDADNAEPFGVLDLADVQGFVGRSWGSSPRRTSPSRSACGTSRTCRRSSAAFTGVPLTRATLAAAPCCRVNEAPPT
jgi:hypothetical protein